MVVWFLDNSDPLYVFGPTGCGKTSCIKQLAARLNYPVFKVTGHSLRRKMVEYANEIRQLFMGAQDSFAGNSLEVTFSTRSLLRWAELTVRYRALAAQGVSPVNYALDRALGFRAGQDRAMLHELAQRMFPHKQSEPAARNKAARPEEAVAFSIDYFSPEMIAQSLEAMVACIVQDPDFVSSLPDLPRVTLAQDTASGGKFWLGLITPDGVSLRWGKAGTAGTAKFIPCGECRRGNPALELKERALGKLGKGYRLVPHNTKLS